MATLQFAPAPVIGKPHSYYGDDHQTHTAHAGAIGSRRTGDGETSGGGGDDMDDEVAGQDMSTDEEIEMNDPTAISAAAAAATAAAARRLATDTAASSATPSPSLWKHDPVVAAFRHSVQTGDLEAFLTSIAFADARRTAADRFGRTEETALHVAAAQGHLPLVAYLVAVAQTPVDVEDGRGTTPLMRAVQGGHDAIVAYLLDHGARLEARDRAGETALHKAVTAQQVAVVDQLLRRGADLHAAVAVDANTALHLAVGLRHPILLQRLLAAGAATAALNGLGETPADIAAKFLWLDGLDLLDRVHAPRHAYALDLLAENERHRLFGYAARALVAQQDPCHIDRYGATSGRRPPPADYAAAAARAAGVTPTPAAMARLLAQALPAPAGYAVMQPWRMLRHGADADGWRYAADFSVSADAWADSDAAFHAVFGSLVRQRRWARLRIALTPRRGDAPAVGRTQTADPSPPGPPSVVCWDALARALHALQLPQDGSRLSGPVRSWPPPAALRAILDDLMPFVQTATDDRGRQAALVATAILSRLETAERVGKQRRERHGGYHDHHRARSGSRHHHHPPPEGRSRHGVAPMAAAGVLYPAPWQPDHTAVHCTECATPFTLLVRKHHCRWCGYIFCAKCTAQRLPIPGAGAGASSQALVGMPPPPPPPSVARSASATASGARRADRPTASPSASSFSQAPSVSYTTPAGPLAPSAPPRPAGAAAAAPAASGSAPQRVCPQCAQFLTSPEMADGSRRGSASTAADGAAAPASPVFPLLHAPAARRPPAPSEHAPDGDGAGEAADLEASVLTDASVLTECPVCLAPLSAAAPAQSEAHLSACLASGAPPGAGPSRGGPASAAPPSGAQRGVRYVITTQARDDPHECDICFETFDAGQKMVTLDCLCRYHHDCIVEQWWRHAGIQRGCPLHAM